MIKIEKNNIIKEKTNGWLVALSILVPLAGLIIFITQRDKQPKTAKISGICALVRFIVMIPAIVIILIGFTIRQTALDTIKNDIFNEYEEKVEDNYSNRYENSSNSNNLKKNEKYVLANAKDIVSLNVLDAVSKYYQEKINNEELQILDYIVKGLKKSKSELEEQNVSITAKKNKIYLKYNNYTVTGTLSDEGKITWSDIEEE